METFAVFYDYDPADPAVADTRPEHRAFLRELLDAGNLVGSGPFTDGDGGALIVLALPAGATAATVEEMMDRDPFHSRGLLRSRSVRPWSPVLNTWS